jgi:hypothetical protein
MEARQRQAELNNARAEAREAEQQQQGEEKTEDEDETNTTNESEVQQGDQEQPKADGSTRHESDDQKSTNGDVQGYPPVTKSPPSSSAGMPKDNNDDDEGDIDRKLPALVPSSSSASSNRDKRVRIVDPIMKYHDGSPSNDGQPAFPAFYRVVQDDGAPVYNDGDAISFVIRIVPLGVVLIGQELAWRDCDGEKMMMLRMPDGWIRDDDVERIVSVPFDS